MTAKSDSLFSFFFLPHASREAELLYTFIAVFRLLRPRRSGELRAKLLREESLAPLRGKFVYIRRGGYRFR